MNARKFVMILLIFIIVAGAVVFKLRSDKSKMVFADHVEDIAFTIDGKDISFREIAFYLAYEELEVEKQALVYDPDNTAVYWNMHTNGIFIRLEARNAARDMAIHDYLLSMLAQEKQIELTSEDEETVKSRTSDFVEELGEEQLSKLGVSKEDLLASIRTVAMAQRYQTIQSQEDGLDYSDYSFDANEYDAILNAHTVKFDEDLWDRLDFGNIILEH